MSRAGEIWNGEAAHYGLTESIKESFWVDGLGKVGSVPARNLIFILQQTVPLHNSHISAGSGFFTFGKVVQSSP